MKKIIYVVDALVKPGGIERVLIDKMNYLSSNGFQIVVITYQQGEHPYVFPLSPSIKHIDTDTRFYTVYKHNRIRRILERIKLKKIYKQRLQTIVDAEKPDFIVITTYGIPTCGLVTQLKTNATLIAEAHTIREKTIEGNIHSKNKIRILLDKAHNEYQCRKIKKIDILVLLTQSSIPDWKKNAKKCVVIPNPVTFFPESIPTNRTYNKRIIAVGHLDPIKGFDRLISAFALIAKSCIEWQIHIFGNGDDQQYLNDLIKEHGLLNSIFIHPATSNIYEEYFKSSFLVMSSRFEGFGLVLTEAMSCGLPCVSFRCKYGPEDIIEDGKTGLLVKDGDIYELADKILWMCQNEDKRKKMGSYARQSAEKYRIERIMPLWIDLFNNIDQ